MANDPNHPKKRLHTNPSISTANEVPLLRLRDQVAVSASQHGELEGSALLVLLAMYRAFAILDRDQTLELAAMGLTTLQFNMLTVLHRTRQPMTMGALAAMLVVQPTNLSSNFNALSVKGLVRRELNRADHRSLLAVLTPTGHEFLERVLPGHWERLEKLMAELPRRQRITLVALLRKLKVSIQKAPLLAPSLDQSTLVTKRGRHRTSALTDA